MITLLQLCDNEAQNSEPKKINESFKTKDY